MIGPNAWPAKYPHACVGCHAGIRPGDVIEYNPGHTTAGTMYRHAQPTCRGRWTVRLELEPWHDGEGERVPPPAVWTVRAPGGAVVFVTDDALYARRVADARARDLPDPMTDE